MQEAEAKAASLGTARWQLVGHLQSNKAARAAALFEEIHSLDSLELARRLSAAAVRQQSQRGENGGQPLGVYLQVNVDADERKSGFAPNLLGAQLDELLELPALRVLGLMTVGRLFERPEQARPTFSQLRELSARLRLAAPALGAGLSMGMSDDFEVAVEEGATVVRLGRVLFGPRQAA